MANDYFGVVGADVEPVEEHKFQITVSVVGDLSKPVAKYLFNKILRDQTADYQYYFRVEDVSRVLEANEAG